MLAMADHADLDDGPRTKKSATSRMCAVTRQVRSIDELVRFVVSPTGDVTVDLKRKLPGRGLWLTASQRTVAEAVRRHQFSKGFKRDVRTAATLAADVEQLLARHVIDALAIAAKAGAVVAGFTRVEEALGQNSAEALVHASDAAADGVRKLNAINRRNGPSGERPVVSPLKSAELDLALGRSNVIHAALLANPASKTFLTRSQLLVRYRMVDDRGTASDTAKNSNLSTPDAPQGAV